MSGIKDVANLAGVSISTVSNVLNKSKYVSPELIKKVEDAVKELSYEANPIARSMKNNHSGVIGVITEDMCGLFYPYVVRGINSVTMDKGYQIIICDAKAVKENQDSVKYELELFRRLFSARVDGIIFASSVPEDKKKKYFEQIKKLTNKYKNIPLVSIERNFESEGIDSVYFDTFENSKIAVQHLVDCGCKKICHIAGPTNMQIANDRVKGYKKCMEENGMEFHEGMIIEGDYSHQSGYMSMKQLLDEIPDLDGVFCGNDQMAIGAMKILKEKHIRVPEDIKVIGYDDVFLSSVVEPSLSTIHIKKKHAGIEAAKILMNRMESEKKDHEVKSIKMEANLVVRKSTVSTAHEDWILSDW